MTYHIHYTPEAEKHLEQWQHTGQKKTLLKLFCLIDELRLHPRTGTGRPECLKGDKRGLWSRRIDKKNRLIYSIEDDVVTVEVISAMGHYEDK